MDSDIHNSILAFDPEAVIIDAGTLPSNPRALRWLEGSRHTVCCDGAVNSFEKTGYRIWRVVGDCDSIDPSLADKYASILRPNPDQETNDQTKAIHYLKGRLDVKRVVILGATGKREDHTLGNISLLPTYLDEGIEARIYTDYGVFIPVRDTYTFHCPRGTQVSVFNFGATGISSEGLRYPLRDFNQLWQGTLNESTAPSFTIHARGPYLVYLTYERKEPR